MDFIGRVAASIEGFRDVELKILSRNSTELISLITCIYLSFFFFPFY
jgi:hypothetical protein